LIVHSGAALKRSLRARGGAPVVFYTKNYVPALVLLAIRRFRNIRVVFEAHVPPLTGMRRFVLRHVDGVVSNSHALAADLGITPRRLIALHQGVDLRPYVETDRTTLRLRIGLPVDRALAVYTGKLYYRYQEIEQIVQAASSPLTVDTLFVLVGGRDDHVALWRAEVERRAVENVVFTGFVLPSIVHEYQMAADVLLLYYTSGSDLNAYRSPGKLFGYMATGIPIVAVDLPVLREVLGDPPSAVMVPQDAPDQLARAIREVLDNPALARRKALDAKARVEEFTWDARARRVIDFVDGLA
jgi:glycosyltransferase involved in cell wall biosynthesis